MWVLLALAAAAMWGSADFLGGLAARLTHALLVLLIGIPAGLVLLLPFLGPASRETLVWGAASGLFGGAGLALLYAALGMASMNIVAPLSAITGAAVPVIAGLVQGEQPGPWSFVGMAVAAGAVVLISRQKGTPTPGLDSHRGVPAALAAGVLIGLGVVFLDHVAGTDSLWPVAANRVGVIAVILVGLAIVAVGGEDLSVPPRSVLPLALGAGILDTVANAFNLIALRTGLLSVVGVIIALYPGVTVLLAWAFLHERLQRIQVVGLGLAAVGIGLLVLG